MEQKIIALIRESIAVKEKLTQKDLIASIVKLVDLAVNCLKNEGKIILFGNGGSAADSQHIAAELVGRFIQEKKALAALALSCNTSSLTSISNDYDFKQVFARQIEALGQAQDLAIGISTSGNSPNVLKAIFKAKEMGMKTAVFTGKPVKPPIGIADVLICVPSKNTARIQEAHITIGHIMCELIEQGYSDI